MTIPSLKPIKQQILVSPFIILLSFTMKPQTVFVLVSLIGMLLTLQQVEGDLGHIAIQSVGNVAFNSLSIFFIFQTKL